MAAQASTNVIREPLVQGSSVAVPASQSSVRVIVADDSSISRKLTQHLLTKWGMGAELASDGNQAWELIQAKDVPTIAILDWMMPGVEGIELCRRIRQVSRQHYTYTMLLTSKSAKCEIIQGLNAGADDYITKPYDPEEMQARLLVALRIMRFQEELFSAREVMREQARHDYLTNLLNRGGIMDALEQELSRSQRTGKSFSVIMADIDHFKKINDTFGHLIGDQVLSEVAWRTRGCMRPYDSVGRYGGEEFLMIVPDCSSDPAFQVAEKIRNAIYDPPVTLDGKQVTITISLGVCTWSPGKSSDQLLMAADLALYRAKESGRNCTRISLTNAM